MQREGQEGGQRGDQEGDQERSGGHEGESGQSETSEGEGSGGRDGESGRESSGSGGAAGGAASREAASADAASMHSAESEHAESEHAESVRAESVHSADGSDGSDGSVASSSASTPPTLKYSRLNLPPPLFSPDPLSTCTFHDAVFIFATHSGLLHVTRPDMTPVRTFKAHRALVLSVYTDGSFFASALMDGTVVIGLLADAADIVAFDFKRPVHAVVLDRNYRSARSFVTGGMGGRVVRLLRNWLGQRADVVLDAGNGLPIVGIFQLDDVLFWMNDAGIAVYHTPTRTRVTTLARPPGLPRADLYWPRVHFPEVDRVVIGWGSHVWLLRVGAAAAEPPASSARSARSARIAMPSLATILFRSPQRVVEVEHVLEVAGSLVAGISFKDDLCMVLTYEPPSGGEWHNPELKLINPATGEVAFDEEIGMRAAHLGLNDYTLGTHIGDALPRYFIISAKDAVVAQQTLLEDHLEWLVAHERYYDAWRMSEHLVGEGRRMELGVAHLDALVGKLRWVEAAEFLGVLLGGGGEAVGGGDEAVGTDGSVSISGDRGSIGSTTSVCDRIGPKGHKGSVDSSLGDGDAGRVAAAAGAAGAGTARASQWSSWASIFIDSDHIAELTPVIPRRPCGLPSRIYTAVLRYWLSRDPATAVALLSELDPDMLDVRAVAAAIEERLEAHPDAALRRGLVDLYVRAHEPARAVAHLLALNDAHLVQFLARHHLLPQFEAALPRAIEAAVGGRMALAPPGALRGELAAVVAVLVAHRHELAPRRVLALMPPRLDYVSHLYLEQLSAADEFAARPFGNERIELCVQYDRGALLGLLTAAAPGQRAPPYDLGRAIELCERHELTEELVYLLGRAGQTRRALMLIIDKLADPAKAIRFARHHNDEETWRVLLDYLMQKPAFIRALIELADDHLSPFYDAVLIIERIPPDVAVEGLRAAVTKILGSNELSLVVSQLVLKVVYREAEHVSTTFRAQRLRGVPVDPEGADAVLQFKTAVVYAPAASAQSAAQLAAQSVATATATATAEAPAQAPASTPAVAVATLPDYLGDDAVALEPPAAYSTLAAKVAHLERIRHAATLAR